MGRRAARLGPGKPGLLLVLKPPHLKEISPPLLLGFLQMLESKSKEQAAPVASAADSESEAPKQQQQKKRQQQQREASAEVTKAAASAPEDTAVEGAAAVEGPASESGPGSAQKAEGGQDRSKLKSLEMLGYEHARDVMEECTRRAPWVTQTVDHLMRSFVTDLQQRPEERAIQTLQALLFKVGHRHVARLRRLHLGIGVPPGQRDGTCLPAQPAGAESSSPSRPPLQVYRMHMGTKAEVPKVLAEQLDQTCRSVFSGLQREEGAAAAVNDANSGAFLLTQREAMESDLRLLGQEPVTIADVISRLKFWISVLRAYVDETVPHLLRLEDESPTLQDLRTIEIEMPGRFPLEPIRNRAASAVRERRHRLSGSLVAPSPPLIAAALEQHDHHHAFLPLTPF